MPKKKSRFVAEVCGIISLMRNPIIALLLTFGFLAQAALTGPGVNLSALTPPQSELDRQAKAEGWTFKYQASPKPYFFGLINPGTKYAHAPDFSFLVSQSVKLPKRFTLEEWSPLAEVYDQGNCGSCVYNAVNGGWMDTMRVRSVVVPTVSRQELMDCWARDWRCNGSYFEKVAAGLVEAGQLHAESDYPYRAVNGTCKTNVPGQKYGSIQSYRIIDNTPKSIVTALRSYYAVPATVGAGGAWMSYRGGVFNACSLVGTNHQIEIIGYDCESAVDANGDCKFDTNGKLPAGVGLWKLKNSWGTSWGEQGYMWTKMTDKNGRLCNNLAEEAGILEVGIEPKPECEPQPKADAGPEKMMVIQ